MTKLTAWLVLGIIMALGPILAMLPAIINRVMEFRNLAQGGQQAEILDPSIQIGMPLSTAACLLCPAGIAIVVVSTMKLGSNSNR